MLSPMIDLAQATRWAFSAVAALVLLLVRPKDPPSFETQLVVEVEGEHLPRHEADSWFPQQVRRDQSQAGSDYRRAHNAQMWRERAHIPVPLPTRLPRKPCPVALFAVASQGIGD